MKIGIYKPFKEVFFYDDSQDVSAWSYEVVNAAKIFVDHHDDVFLLSKTDLLKNGNLPHISSRLLNELDSEEKFDRIFLWCGSFNLDEYGDDIVLRLRKLTDRLDFFMTDRALVPSDKKLMKQFDHIYIQGTKQIFSKTKDVTESTSELLLYHHNFDLSIDESIARKSVEFYFGGTERNRLDDYIEYVWRPNHLITTKSKFFNFENRIPRDEFLKTLDLAKYSVVITDVENNKDHFISPRPYECYIHDIVPFFDYKYDPDGYYCDKNDFRRVHNYKEMREKMNYLNEHQSIYKKIIKNQRKIASKKSFVSGNYIYNKFK